MLSSQNNHIYLIITLQLTLEQLPTEYSLMKVNSYSPPHLIL